MDDIASPLRRPADGPAPVLADEVAARVAARGRTRRRRLAVAAAAGVLAVVAGASDESVRIGTATTPSSPPEQVRIEGIPVLDGHFEGRGTPLRGGLVVPPGALLLGEVLPLSAEVVLPLSAESPLGRSWMAVLLVTGSPVGVTEDLHRQLDAQAAEVTSACARFAEDGPATTLCELAAFPADGGMVRGEVQRSHGNPAEGPLEGSAPHSHLVLTWGPRPDVPTPFIDMGPHQPDADTPIASGWPDLARPGDLLRPGRTTTRSRGQVRLPAGTFAVGPEFATFGANDLLLLVEGSPSQAMDDLAAGIARDFDPETVLVEVDEPVEAEVEGISIRQRTVHYDLSRYVLSLVSTDGGPAYLLVQDFFLD